jgi:D-alanyl-D-alanine dipeptidase
MSEFMTGTSEQNYEGFRESALYEPIPNMDELRNRKKGYNELPIDVTNPKFNEPVVNIADFGIAGQGYYSRPNAATGTEVPGVPTELFLRQSVAETLASINLALNDPKFTEFFGSEVELYVEDALRSVSLQTKLHDELFPSLIRQQNPDMSNEEVESRIKDMIALLSTDSLKPSPHATGGALDIILRYKQSTPMFVDGGEVPMGHIDGDTSTHIYPDYYEQNPPLTDLDKLAQKNRRAYYAIMTGAASGTDTGFINNPTEWWHWGRGDQLSAKVHGDKSAYYSLAESSL